MSSILNKLRQNRQSVFERTKDAAENAGKTGFKSEFWSPEMAKKGSDETTSVTIRFLPSADEEGLPYVAIYEHFFQGDDDQWLKTLCPTTLGDDFCPICDKNSILWKSSKDPKDPLKDIVRNRKRKQSYIANVLIIKDAKNPENEGKVVQYKFGATIFKMLQEALNPPQLEDEEEPAIPFNPFDLWEGANLVLRTFRDPDKQNNISYIRSKFQKQSELFDGNETKLEELLEQCVDLKKFVNESYVTKDLQQKANKAYANLIEVEKPRFEKPKAIKETPKNDDDPFSGAGPSSEESEADMEAWMNKSDEKTEEASVESDSDETDLEYFKKLCEE